MSLLIAILAVAQNTTNIPCEHYEVDHPYLGCLSIPVTVVAFTLYVIMYISAIVLIALVVLGLVKLLTRNIMERAENEALNDPDITQEERKSIMRGRMLRRLGITEIKTEVDSNDSSSKTD